MASSEVQLLQQHEHHEHPSAWEASHFSVIDHGPTHNIRKYDGIEQMLSDVDNPTPLVRLNRITKFKHTQVYGKLEWYNPFGSIKDRVAANIIKEGKHKGLTCFDWVEPSTGNTVIGMQLLLNTMREQKSPRYRMHSIIPAQLTDEKKNTLRLFGSETIEMQDFTDFALQQSTGEQIHQQKGFAYANQYASMDNPAAHYKTTGPEIWKQTEHKITHVVVPMGTCGTIKGLSKYFREVNPKVKIIGVYPEEHADVSGVRPMNHLKYLKHFNPKDYDMMIEISNKEAYYTMLQMNQKESIAGGPSSGMSLAGCLKAVPDEPDNLAVFICPDQCFKYATGIVKNMPEVFGQVKSGEDNLKKIDQALKNVAIMDSPQQKEAKPVDPLENAGLGFILSFADTIPLILQTIKSSSDNLDSAELLKFMEHKPTIINIIEQAESQEIPAPLECIDITLKDFIDDYGLGKQFLPKDPSAPILVVSNTGVASLYALLNLKNRCYIQNSKTLKNGMQTWKEANLPHRHIKSEMYM